MSDFIPDSEFIPDTPVVTTSESSQPTTPDFISEKDFISDEEKYGTTEQEIKAGLEGAAEGVLGSLAPLIETKVFGVDEQDIKNRKEQSPLAHGIGFGTTLAGGILAGTGLVGQGAAKAAQFTLPGLMTKAGVAATEAVGLGTKVAEGASLATRLGHEAVKQAAEMAVMQGSDEVAKVVLHDPAAGAENAIANIGMAAALGGIGGAGLASVSPLWKATAGPKVESLLNKIKPGSLEMSPKLKSAFETLEIEAGPIAKAITSGDDKALHMVQENIRGQHAKTLEELATYPKQIRENLSKKLGMNIEDAVEFSAKDAGDAVEAQLKKDIEKRYGPIHAEQQARAAKAENIATIPEDRVALGSSIMERGLKEVTGPDSPYYKTYEHYADRVLKIDSIGKLDKLSTEIGNKARTIGLDTNEKYALNNIGRMINEFQEAQIEKHVVKEGVEALGKDVLAERALAKQNYKEYVGKMQDLMDFIGVGRWRGTGSLQSKLEGLTSEQIIKKFSTKGDVEGLKFLKAEFPEVAELVRQYETKKFLSGAVKTEMGEVVLDSKKLASAVEKLRKDSPEMIDHLLPNGAADSIDAAKAIHDALTHVNRMKDSGTPGGIAKVFKHVGGSAMGTLGWILGHNPIAASIIGEMSQRLAVNGPQEIRHALIKIMTSDMGVSGSGFKAVVDYAGKVAKEQAKIQKSIEGVFKGSYVVASNPDQSDRDKLQKNLDKLQKNPESMIANADKSDLGHYMPDQLTAIATTTARAAQYLESIRPRSFKPGPLDKEIPPSKAEMARYNKALDIANKPTIVLQHIKDGTIQISDIQDLKAMYPALYSQFSRQLIDQITSLQANEELIPYKTKVGISLFLTTPLDASMKPEAIMSAQPKPTAPPAPQKQPSKVSNKGADALKRMPSAYMTPNQQSIANKAPGSH